MTSAEKKKYLSSFEQAEKRVIELEKELENLNKLDARYNWLNESFNAELDKLIDLLQDIEHAISGLENANERRVLWLKYVGDLKYGRRHRLYLWQIGNVMGYSEEWVKKAHHSAIEHLNI